MAHERHTSADPAGPGASPPGDGGASPRRILGIGLAALAALYAGAWLFLRLDGDEERAAPTRAEAAPAEAAPAIRDAAPPSAAPQSAGPARAAAAAPARAEEASPVKPREERTGLAVFPPMGSKPIQRGILVPDDFELPPGYIRHRQATDDGQLLPAILKFHPDYSPIDKAGNTIDLPPDGIVPPELAPPGLPIRYLEPPPQGGAKDEAK